MCGGLKLSLERVQGLLMWSTVYNNYYSVIVEDVDGDDDTDTGQASGWEVVKDLEGELAVGSQIAVKVCWFTYC